MTCIGKCTMICLVLVISVIIATPLFAAETDPPVIDRSSTDTGDAWNFLVNGHYAEGPCEAVDVRNDTAFVGNGTIFQIVDFANSSPPALLGELKLPEFIEGIKVEGNYAYVANNGSGLQIIDISNPTAPSVTGVYDAPNYSLDVDVIGSTVYLANSWDGLRLIDVSTPSTPSEISRYDTDGSAASVEVIGDYAYLACTTAGLYIIDISTPETPTEAGQYDSPNVYYQLDVEGDYAYAAAYTAGIEVVDISNPLAPSLAGERSLPGATSSICVDGLYAYAGTKGIRVVDIQDPTNPVEIGSDLRASDSQNLVVSGNRLYVAMEFGGCVAYNVGTPANPVVVTTHDTGGRAESVAAAEGVTGNAPGEEAAGSDYVYIAHGGDGIRILDVTNPSSPTVVGNYVASNGARADFVTIVDHYLYTGWTDGFRVIDVANPAQPSEVGYYDSHNTEGIWIVGNYAYVAARTYGLYVIDISNKLNPTEAGVYDTPGTAWDVVYNWNTGHIHVADYQGMRIIDVSTPSAPTEVGSYTVPEQVYSISQYVDYAYVGSSQDGVYVIDTSTPSAPVEVAIIDPGYNIRDVHVRGNYLYIARAFSGIDVAYINDKFNSPLVGSFDTAGSAENLFAINTNVYVADMRAGVWMLEFEPPPTPTFISAFYCEPVEGGVELSWQILSDDVVRGFNVYRSDGGSGYPQIVNTGGIIPPDADRFTDKSAPAGNTCEYTLAVVLADGSEILSQPKTVQVGAFELTLNENYPNPFNPVTTIRFVLPSGGHTNLTVYNADGTLVRTIVDEPLSQGRQSYTWNGKDENGNRVSSGVYFCRLESGGRILTQKMTLIK